MSVESSQLASLRIAVERIVARGAAPAGAAASDRSPLAIEAVDLALGGGLPRGRITELVGRRSAGRTALSMAALAAAGQRGEAVALVDVGGMLDARSAAAAGVALETLLWVRVPDARRGVQAAHILLEAGGFGLVVLDVGEQLPRTSIGDAAWLRLGRAAERSASPRAALLLVAPSSVARSFATLGLEAGRSTARWQPGGGPHLLRGASGRLLVTRSRLGPAGETADVAWQLR